MADKQRSKEELKQGLSEGPAEGLRRGMSEGPAEGLRQGMSEGPAEKLEGGLFEKLKEYGKKGAYPFHMPGHKRNGALGGDIFPFSLDITEITGFDNLHCPTGVILKAQERAARIYGTKESFFSVNGSTGCILAAVSAAFSKGDRVLVARNCHKSVYHALCLRELEPVFVYPRVYFEKRGGGRNSDEEENCPGSEMRAGSGKVRRGGLFGGIAPDDVEEILCGEEGIKGMILTSPTYDGIVSDLRRIGELLHERDLPLLVDEAHGAHFVFSDYFPESAVSCGADLVIHSVHKTLPALTQTALLHRCSERVESRKIRRFLSIYQSSSPSYVLMASLDACMALLEKEGEGLFTAFTERLEKTRERLGRNERLVLLEPEKRAGNAVYDFDRSRILIGTGKTPMSGHRLFALLRDDYGLELEMEAPDYVLALSSAGDTEEGFRKLIEAVADLDGRLKETEIRGTACVPGLNEQVFPMHEALEMDSVPCPLEACEGRISGEFVFLYPPGIPLVVPGERISGNLAEELIRYRREGYPLQGLQDLTAQNIQVLDRLVSTSSGY